MAQTIQFPDTTSSTTSPLSSIQKFKFDLASDVMMVSKGKGKNKSIGEAQVRNFKFCFLKQGKPTVCLLRLSVLFVRLSVCLSVLSEIKI